MATYRGKVINIRCRPVYDDDLISFIEDIEASNSNDKSEILRRVIREGIRAMRGNPLPPPTMEEPLPVMEEVRDADSQVDSLLFNFMGEV